MQEYVNELDPQAVPYEAILEAINFMTYGSLERVMFEMLVLTGCRTSELGKLSYNDQQNCFLAGNWLYWRPGKCQKGWRKEYLPRYYLKELAYFRSNNKVWEDKIFPVHQDTFRAYFNKTIRPYLGLSWQTKRPIKYDFGGYTLQLKGIRKTFVTHIFFKEYETWKDAGVALDMISKRMKHSRTGITCNAYVRNFESLNLKKWGSSQPWEILALANQRHLKEFEPDLKALTLENAQARIQDFA